MPTIRANHATVSIISRLVAMLLGLSISGLVVAMGWWWLTHHVAPEYVWKNRDFYRRDDLAGHLHRPGATRSYEWEEHPLGRLTIRTNNLGFREDADTALAKPPGVVRILVTGDSHTDGVVLNAESFANRLEAQLNAAHGTGGPRFEVLNGGTGHYGPQNYAGFLDRFLELEPDLFVVALYGGNDFADALAYAEWHGEIESGERPDGYFERLELLKRVSGVRYAGRSQGVNQLYLFKVKPELQQVALDLTTRAFLEIRDRCREHDIGLVVLLLPTLLDVEWQRDAERNEVVRSTLGLEEADLAINRQLALRLASRLAEAGVATLDLHPLMLAPDSAPLFWVKDYHLATGGHRVVADALLDHPVVQALRGAPAPVAVSARHRRRAAHDSIPARDRRPARPTRPRPGIP